MTRILRSEPMVETMKQNITIEDPSCIREMISFHIFMIHTVTGTVMVTSSLR